jgi:hypothetical protein
MTGLLLFTGLTSEGCGLERVGNKGGEGCGMTCEAAKSKVQATWHCQSVQVYPFRCHKVCH